MPRRKRLERRDVIWAAARLLEEEGPAAFTLHQLARRLGIQTPSLYNHIEGMAGLRADLAVLNAQKLADAMEQAAIGRSGAEALYAVAQAVRSYIKSSPVLYQFCLLSSGNKETPNKELKAAEERSLRVGLAIVQSFNLQGEDAVHALRGLRSLIHGFASLEAAGGFGMPLDCDDSFHRLLEAYSRGLADIASAKDAAID